MEATPFISRPSIFDKDRIVTNRATLRVFAFCLITWIASLIIAFFTNDCSKKANEPALTIMKQDVLVDFGLSWLIAGVFAIVLLAVMRHVPKFSGVVFVTFWIPMYLSTQNFKSDPNLSNGFLMIVPYLSCWFTLYLLNAEWLHLPERVLKESCKVLVIFKSSIAFVILLNIVCLFILYVMMVATMYITTLDLPMAVLTIIIILNYIISGWTVLTISCIGHMTLSGVYATWFWTEPENKTWSNTGLLLRSLKLMCTYHIGTAAYATSPIGLMSTFFKLLVHASRKCNEGSSTSLIIFIIYNFFDCVMMKIALLGATVKCAMNGTDYQVSADEALEDFKKHPKRCLVVTKVLEHVIVFVIIILTASMIFCLPRIVTEENLADYVRKIAFLTIGSLVFILPIFWMLIPASCTILFCVIEDLSIHNGSQERPYAMSYKLQKALNHNGPPNCIGSCMTCCIALAQLWFLFLI